MSDSMKIITVPFAPPVPENYESIRVSKSGNVSKKPKNVRVSKSTGPRNMIDPGPITSPTWPNIG
jgi:hypothetical protein